MGKVADTINENYYTQIAGKITQLLDKIRNSSLSDKRWVWELMQNAKDVPNKFDRVSIKIELWSDKLVFSHNGDYFTDKNITGLIQQVSSKDSANEGEEKQTGKFGTGFITTHLLSNTIYVSGIVLNPNTNQFQRFKLTLDRSAKKSEDMIDSIKQNLKWIEGLDKNNIVDFPIVDNYDSRTEEDFDTSFAYPLSSDSLKSAQIGLEDLVNTLPITMVSLPKIKSVHIINYITNQEQIYRCTRKELVKDQDKTISLSNISINNQEKYFLTYQVDKEGEPYLALSIEVQKEDDEYILIPRDASQPVLFRDFPLIGSEEFHFPYMLNGFGFEPTETRSGILLNRNADKPKKNRAILQDAIKCALQFNKWLLTQNAKNTYLIASTDEPKPEETYDEDVAKPWIKNQIKLWRKELLEQNILETLDGYVPLKSLVIPFYGTKTANKEFYGFLTNFIKEGNLPLEEQLEAWIKTLSWASEQKYTNTNFFEDLQRVGCVSALATRLGVSESEAYNWLNRLYSFLANQNDLTLLDSYPIVPNQYGNFCLRTNLKTDSKKRIVDVLKYIYKPIIDHNLKDELLAEDIDDSVLGNMTVYNLDSLIQEANGIIAEKSKTTNYSDLQNFMTSVSKIIALDSNTEDPEIRNRFFKFVAQFIDLPSERPFINALPASIWTEADKYILKVVPLLIVANSQETLKGLGTSILQYPQEHSDEESIKWINEYVSLVKHYQMSIPMQKAIFPNQIGELKALEDLHYDMNIPEEYKKLYLVATNNDYHALLLDRHLEGHSSHDPRSTTHLYHDIVTEFDSPNSSEIKKSQIASLAFTIIPQTQEDSTSDCQIIYDLYQRFDNSISEKIIVDGSGFYPEKFCIFMLKKLCKNIAQQVNVSNLSQTIKLDEPRTIDYVNDVIVYTEQCFGNKYGDIINEDTNGIWINQNNDFCLRGDVSKDKGVDEDIKKLALNPIVNIDYKSKLLRKNMPCEFFIPETQEISTSDVLSDIDDALQAYDNGSNSLQAPNCAKLIIELNAWLKRHPGYDSSVKYFLGNQNKLIVGSISDDKTLAVIGSIVASPEKMHLLGEIYRQPVEYLEKIARGEHLILSAQEVAQYYSNVDVNTLPKMELYEDESMSREEQIEYNNEAKKVVLAKLAQDGFDVSQKNEEYSLVSGVTKDEVEYPLVIKSYKNNNYQFRLNPNEWHQLMKSVNSMLLVHRGNGEIDRVSFSQLFKNQDSMSLHFSLENFDAMDNITKFAYILKYFKGCKFDFGSLMTTRYDSLAEYKLGQNNPNAFIDFTPDDPKLMH